MQNQFIYVLEGFRLIDDRFIQASRALQTIHSSNLSFEVLQSFSVLNKDMPSFCDIFNTSRFHIPQRSKSEAAIYRHQACYIM